MTRSRIVRIAAYVLGGLLALAIVILAILQSPAVRRFALGKAVEILSRQGVQFEAGSFDYSLLGASATLRNVTVRSTQAPDLPPLLKVDAVTVKLSLGKLLRGAYHIENATITNPQVHLVVDDKGRDNVPRLPKSESTGKTDYLIHRLLISGGSIRAEDRRQQITVTLPLTQLTVDGDPLTGNHHVQLQAGNNGQITFATRSLPIRELTADTVIESEAVDVRSLKLATAESVLGIQGRLRNFNDPRFDVKADITFALAALSEFAGVKQKMKGNVHAVLEANGPIAQLKAKATLDGDNLTIERFDRLSLKAEAVYDAAAARVRLESLNVGAPAGTIHGKADVALTPKTGQSTANFAADGLNLRQVSILLKLPVQIASSANAKVSVHWPDLQYDKIAGDATVRLAATQSTTAKNVIPVSGAIDVKTQGNRMVIGIPGIDAMNTHASGEVTILNRKGLEGQVKLGTNDIASSVTSAEGYLGDKPGSLLPTAIQGTLDATANLGGTIEKPQVSAQIAAPNLKAGDLSGIDVRASANYTPDQLIIEDAMARWREQAVRASGTVGMGPRDTTLDLTAQTENVTIESVLAGLGKTAIPARGKVSLHARAQGTVKHPRVNATVSATDLAAYEETLGALEAQVEIQDQLAHLTELRLDKPQPGGDGSLTVSGSYNLETGDYTVQAKSENIKLTTMKLPNGQAVRGAFNVDASGQGNRKDPAGEARIAVTNLAIDDKQLKALSLRAQLSNRQANIETVIPPLNLTGSATVSMDEPYRTTFQVTADNTDLANLPVKLDESLKGTVSATVKGSGDLKNYEQGEATAEVTKLDLQWNGNPVRNEGPIRAGYAAKKLNVEQATIATKASRLSIQGTLPLEASAGDGAVRVSAKLDLPDAMRYIPTETAFTVQGAATIEGSIRGNLKRIDPDLTIALDNGYLSAPTFSPPVYSAQIRATIHDGALDIQSAGMNWGPAMFTASGAVPLGLLPADLPVEFPRRQGPAQLTADLKSIELGALQGAPESLNGTVSAHLELQAPKADIATISGKLTLPELHVAYGSYALQQKGASGISFGNGVARVEQFQLTGPQTEIQIAGTAGFTGERPLDLRVDGKLNASIVSAFTDAVRAQGPTEMHVAVTGTAADPKTQGSIQLADGTLSIQRPRVAVEDLNLKVDLAGNRATISQLAGDLNGGTLSGGGTVEYANGKLSNTNLNVKAEGVYFDFPEGLKTISNFDIQVKNAGDNLLVGGQVAIEDGGFRDDLNFDRGILAAVSTTRGLEFSEQRNPMLEQIKFNIGVRTDNPIYINNNLAKAEITADLRVLGDPYDTGLSGRLTIEEGGELTLQERKYEVERGNITFTNEHRIEPNLDIAALTTVQSYDIRLQITGQPGKTETTLTSDPTLPEPDILALLISGKTAEEMRGQEFEVARNQVLSYLTGRVGSTIGRGIESATGLSSVRIEPNLIAGDTDPTARLTVGQDINRNLKVIYSLDLVNSSDQIYIAEYDLTKRFTTRGTRQSDGSFRFDFRHEIRFGGLPEPRRGDKREERRIGAVNIDGKLYFPQETIADKLKAKTGKHYDYFKVRKGLDKVEDLFKHERLLEADVRLRRNQRDHTVDLSIKVDAGPKVEMAFSGIAVPDKTKKRVDDAWHEGVFDTQRAEESSSVLKTWLVEEGYLQAKIDHAIEQPSEDRKQVHFEIQPGARFHDVELVFPGAEGFDAGKLRDVIKDQKISTEVYTKPGRVTDLLTRFYREMGYLDATVGNPRYELDATTGTGKVSFPVDEGHLFLVRKIDFNGNTVFTDGKLSETAPLPKAKAYRPSLRENALQRVRELYWDDGYPDVDIQSVLQRNEEKGSLDLVLNITENRKAVVKEIVVDGNDKTSEKLIRTQVEFKPGEALSFRKLANSRRNLYDTGAFSLVEITREDVGGGGSDNATNSQAGDTPERQLRLHVKVREVQPFELRYGAFYDTERGPGGIFDISNHNSLGSARVIGLRGRWDSQLQEARLYFSQPRLLRFPVRTIVSPFLRREQNPATADADPFNVNRVGFSIQQEASLAHKYVLNYGYRIERSRTFDPTPDPLFDITLRLASLTTTATRETRDEILDATHGSFISHALQYSPTALGSQVHFIKYFGQFFKYFPLQKPHVELFTNKVIRPRLVYATGVRVGLSRGLSNQEVPLSERFLAGGSNTIRGFAQNAVGPTAGGIQLGGEGLLIINSEIRYPLVKWFDGVGFLDVGNVYRKVSDFSFTDIRKAAGVGLRLRTPWFLVRLDYGVKLDRRQGESFGRLFFSIGQAF